MDDLRRDILAYGVTSLTVGVHNDACQVADCMESRTIGEALEARVAYAGVGERVNTKPANMIAQLFTIPSLDGS